MKWYERWIAGLVFGIIAGFVAYLLSLIGMMGGPNWYTYGVGACVGYAIGLRRDD